MPADLAAGQNIARGDGVSLSWNEANDTPLQPLPSARSNRSNTSSVQGGIFGAAPAAAKPISGMARQNPNASSMEGGIFGN